MELHFVRVTRDFSEGERWNGIMLRQFPPEEYLSLEDQLALQDRGEVEIWALYEGGELAGLATLRVTQEMAYLFFLAFDDAYQNRGCGHAALETLRDIYADRAFTVDFELPDSSAANNAQRIRRRNFYRRSGFSETGWGLEYLGVRYEIFCMNRPFQIESFRAMLDRLPVPGFHPQYFKL